MFDRTTQQARLWKLTLSTTLALAVAMETISLGFCFTANPSAIATYSLRLIFAIYTLILAVRSVNQDTIDLHSESVWHLSSLTFIVSVLLFGTAILPPTDAVLVISHQTPALLKSLGWAELALNFISFLVVSNIPQGPPLHFDPERLYSEKTIASITNVTPDNVCGVTGKYSLFCLSQVTRITRHRSGQHLGNHAFLLHYESSDVGIHIRFSRNR